ncbi:hypothetical protein NIES2100_21360 [Calothrix sp. NIES-2100]|uniref:hypothetical protein n=1 Tax=Calothrix sp. NIES-2100 TaxID=1954172 RepID=UPI000B5E88C2|nr:hypothetical protein NIES2100_21360 [Calothrix sp. NIES-2100]
MRQLQLGNSANWELIHNENISAVFLPKQGGGYKAVPIPEISIAAALDVFVVAVRIATVVPEGRTWRFAGFLKQNVTTGIAAFTSADASFNRRYSLFLDKINLIIFPQISTDYSISIKLPDWFENAGIAIWRYTGIDTDSTEELVNQIKNVDIPRLEAKVDALSL